MASPLPIIYLHTAQGISGSIRFQKLVFLGQKESKLPKKYRFIPYKFGPYSYQLQQDIESWIESGEISRERRPNQSGNYRTDYYLSIDGVTTAIRLQEQPGVKKLFDEANKITSKYANKPLSKLLQYVYERYEDYTDESTLDIERLFDESTTSQFTEQNDSQVGPFNHIAKLNEKDGEVAGTGKSFTRQLLKVGPDFQVTLERIDETSFSIYWRTPSSSFEEFRRAIRDDTSISSDAICEMRTQDADGWIRGECEELLNTVDSDTCLFFRTQANDEKFTVTWESGSGYSGDEITLYVTEDKADYEALRAALVRYATSTALETDIMPGSLLDTTDKLTNQSLRQTAKYALC